MLMPYGILPAMITPLTKDEKLNEKSLEKMINYTIENGVHGIFAMGTTAEFYAVSREEYRDVLTAAKAFTAGRVPFYAGANSITTREAVALVKIATDVGADAISVLTPMFISPSEEELYEHYRAIAESTDKPILLYNNAPKTGVNLSVDLVTRLAEIPNIVGIKDSKGDFIQLSREILATQGKDFNVLVGNDALIYATLCHGGAGAVAASANVAPRLVVDIYENYRKGDLQAALKCQNLLTPLRVAFTLGTFPSVIKESLAMLGIDAGVCFAPIRPFNDEQRAKLRAILENMGILQ